jgi:hypothetical protein
MYHDPHPLSLQKFHLPWTNGLALEGPPALFNVLITYVYTIPCFTPEFPSTMMAPAPSPSRPTCEDGNHAFTLKLHWVSYHDRISYITTQIKVHVMIPRHWLRYCFLLPTCLHPHHTQFALCTNKNVRTLSTPLSSDPALPPGPVIRAQSSFLAPNDPNTMLLRPLSA